MKLHAALVTITAAAPSAARDANARAQAGVVLTNLRTLIEECEAILGQADGFTTVATWMPQLGASEWHLERIAAAMAASAGLVAA